MSGRLKVIDYEEIIEKGEPWKDPDFPYGKCALFINNSKPRKGQEEIKSKSSSNSQNELLLKLKILFKKDPNPNLFFRSKMTQKFLELGPIDPEEICKKFQNISFDTNLYSYG